MLQPGASIYIRDPQSVLCSGSIFKAEDGELSVIFEDIQFDFTAGQTIQIFFHVHWKFKRQDAQILSLVKRETALYLDLKVIGEPVSAEQRESYRVSTLTTEIRCRLGDEPVLEVVNVSAGGFSVITTQELALGDVLNAALEFRDEHYEGAVRIKCVQKLRDGRMRYGLRAQEDDQSGRHLPAGLRALSITIERELLQRLSGRV